MFGVTDSDYATLTGAIIITPSLDWSEIKGSPYIDADGAIGAGSGSTRSRQLKFIVDEHEGGCPCSYPPSPRPHTHFTRIANAVTGVSKSNHYANNILEDLDELVRTFPDRRFVGYIDVVPFLSSEPRWRLCVVDGAATQLHPMLVWPKGRPHSHGAME